MEESFKCGSRRRDEPPRCLNDCAGSRLSAGLGISTSRIGNSTDEISCESLLADLRVAQGRGDVALGSTEKMLIVILERIVGDDRRERG